MSAQTQAQTQTYKPAITRLLPALLTAALLIAITATAPQTAHAKKVTRDVQVSRSIFLQPVAPPQRIVWLRIRNTTALQDVKATQLQQQLAEQLRQIGYLVVDDPTQAQYQLQVNIRLSQQVSRSWSAQACLLAGKVTRDAVEDDIINGIDKTTAGLAACGLAAATGRLFKKVKHALLVDVRLGERLDDAPIVDTMHTSDNTRSGAVNLSNINHVAQPTGGTTQVVRRKENFLNHEIYIGASVEGRRLKTHQAVPYLVEDVVTSIVNML